MHRRPMYSEQPCDPKTRTERLSICASLQSNIYIYNVSECVEVRLTLPKSLSTYVLLFARNWRSSRCDGIKTWSYGQWNLGCKSDACGNECVRCCRR